MSVRDEAEALIQDGFRVWPISRATRTPIRAGFARANGPEVCASAEEFTDATEVGVLCGPCPAAGPNARYVCVDYDGPVPAENRVGGAPTLTSKDGAHEWYRVPPEVTGFRQTQHLRTGPGWGVDTRDFGGYARETTDGEPLWDSECGMSHPRDITQAEVDALFPPAAAPAAPYVPPAGPRITPSQASVASFVHRVVSNPDATNQCFGALGACLASWSWSDADIAAAIASWFGDYSLGRHPDSAIRAANTRRTGGVVPGFPKMAELGVTWAAERPAELDVTAVILAAQTEAPACGEPPFYLRSARDIRTKELPDIQWVCEALSLAPGAPGLCTGYSGVGKTTALQDLALSVATPGRRWLNYYPVRHGRVAHVDLEQGEQQTYRTYRALGLDETTPDDALACSVLPQWQLTDPENLASLTRLAVGRTLIIIDSFRAACLSGDENASEFAAPLAELSKISEATGCTFMLNHHSGKNNSDRMRSARGTSAITAACSVHWSFEREDLDPATRPCLQLIKSRNHATEAMVWETYVEKVGTADSFQLHARANGGAEEPTRDAAAERIENLVVLELTNAGPDGLSFNQLADRINMNRNKLSATVRNMVQNKTLLRSKTGLRLGGIGT